MSTGSETPKSTSMMRSSRRMSIKRMPYHHTVYSDKDVEINRRDHGRHQPDTGRLRTTLRQYARWIRVSPVIRGRCGHHLHDRCLQWMCHVLSDTTYGYREHAHVLRQGSHRGQGCGRSELDCGSLLSLTEV